MRDQLFTIAEWVGRDATGPWRIWVVLDERGRIERVVHNLPASIDYVRHRLAGHARVVRHPTN